MSKRKTYVYVKRGLVEDPKHRNRIGNRLWLYIHILHRADWETGVVYDWKDKEEAEDLAMSWRSLQEQRQELADLQYIKCVKKKHNLDIVIANWVNPRSYSGEVLNKRETLFESTAESTVKSTAESTGIDVTKSTAESTGHLRSNSRTPSIVSDINSQWSPSGINLPLNSDTAHQMAEDKKVVLRARVAAAAAEFEHGHEGIEDTYRRHFKRNVNWNTESNGEVMKWLRVLNPSEEQWKHFSHYWRTANWRGKDKDDGIMGDPPSPQQIQEFWTVAMEWQGETKEEPLRKNGSGYDV